MKKKIIILLVITLLFVSGCSNTTKDKKTSKSNNEASNITENNKTENEEDTKLEESESTNTNNQQNNDSQQTNSSTESPANNQTGNVAPAPVQPTCTSKKFDHTYSYVYTTVDECKIGGNEAFLTITEDGTSDIFAYDCQTIVDECGTTYYGVIFYNAPNSIVYR